MAVTLDPGGGGVDPIVEEGVRHAADALDQAGWQVHEAEPPDVGTAAEVWMRLVSTEIAATWPVLDQLVGGDARAFLRDALAYSPPLDRGVARPGRRPRPSSRLPSPHPHRPERSSRPVNRRRATATTTMITPLQRAWLRGGSRVAP